MGTVGDLPFCLRVTGGGVGIGGRRRSQVWQQRAQHHPPFVREISATQEP